MNELILIVLSGVAFIVGMIYGYMAGVRASDKRWQKALGWQED